jgi:hypothetical protein
MLHARRQAAAEVASKLFALEAAIDQALVCAGELMAAAPQARMKAKLSAVVGQDAMDFLGASSSSLNAARGQIVAAHHALADIHEQIGLKTFASGDLWKLSGSLPSPLTLVSKAA